MDVLSGGIDEICFYYIDHNIKTGAEQCRNEAARAALLALRQLFSLRFKRIAAPSYSMDLMGLISREPAR
jgi:hypothetical protein